MQRIEPVALLVGRAASRLKVLSRYSTVYTKLVLCIPVLLLGLAILNLVIRNCLTLLGAFQSM